MPATRFVLVAAMLLGSQAAEVTTVQKFSMILPPFLFASVGYGARENVAEDPLAPSAPETKAEYSTAFALLGRRSALLLLGSLGFGEKVIKVHDLYDGKGAKFENMVPAFNSDYFEPYVPKTKDEYAAAFIPEKKLCTDADWQGTLIDMFTPDDTNPDSKRFLVFAEEAGELQVSADTGGEKWGRLFDKTTSVNPVLVPTAVSCVRRTSFISKVPQGAPAYAEALDGALDFTLVLGTAFGEKVIKWNGLYDGKGGKFGGNSVPASDSDNFWRYLPKTKEEYAAAFIPQKLCTDADWQGTFIDLFSPDVTNKDSRRFLDVAEEAGELQLQVSADTGGEKWGRRFDKTTSVNPVLAPTEVLCVRKTSFLSKVPPGAPIYAEAMAGALEFTLVLGTAFGEKVIKWNGLYDGKGGKFGGKTVPASDSDNFWRYDSETAS